MKSTKVMLITGATFGIGKALAEYFYKKNYK
jgi:NAD(P)-dependent dehydrogenase (short-subunit alcohol dehydrogenase family)